MDSTKRQPLLENVQALRALAALLVVFSHMALANVGVEDILPGEKPWMGPFVVGIFGVDLFFVISGFIMIVTNWDSFGKPWAGPKFLARRAIRIYPPYWFATIPVFIVFELARNRFMVSHATGETGIIESFLLLPNPHRFILTVGWTLVWEMVFYVVFALILPFNRRYVPALLGLWFVVEVALNRCFDGTTNFFLDFIHATLPIEFIYGAAIGVLYVNRRMPPLWLLSIAAILTMGTAFTIRLVTNQDFPIDRVYFFGIPAALTVFAAVASETRGTFVAPKIFSQLGNGSYAVYLWHLSIIAVLRQLIQRLHPTGPVAHAIVILTTTAVVLVLAQLIYHFFERPVTAYLNARFSAALRSERSNKKPPQSIGAAVEMASD